MRQIILDTETTGLDPKQCHRIIEIGGIELVNRRPTGRHFHYKINPEREIDPGATEVHGMTWEDLKDKPKFCEISAEFIEFASGAEWIIHNAPFDIAFLDYEFSLSGIPLCAHQYSSLLDTLKLAREQFPGKRNHLDALCERFAVANAQRTLHGALLDAQLLAEVYLAMTRGQESLLINVVAMPYSTPTHALSPGLSLPMRVLAPTDEEAMEHRAYLDQLEQVTRRVSIWRQLEASAELMPLAQVA